jgi:hypothetical protein
MVVWTPKGCFTLNNNSYIYKKSVTEKSFWISAVVYDKVSTLIVKVIEFVFAQSEKMLPNHVITFFTSLPMSCCKSRLTNSKWGGGMDKDNHSRNWLNMFTLYFKWDKKCHR